MVWGMPFQRYRSQVCGIAVAICIAAASSFGQPVTTSDLEAAADNTAAWLTYGRDYLAQRYVDLDQIHAGNVHRLQPVWAFATGGRNRGLEATPLMHAGVLYVSADDSRVFAIDAASGDRLWAYDPKISPDAERVYCCGPVNRGVALLGERVFVGTMDARLVALDRRTGRVDWEASVEDWQQGYSVTGAPLVVQDMVLTGVAGGEFGIRGFVKAYDAQSGELRWTAHTIPAPGEPGNETWPGETWRHGGASTWTTGAYDPSLELIYWNTGNAAPWNCQVRKGDNKWAASTIAIEAGTGRIAWGYQYTPWDCWDYDAVSTPLLADVELDGIGPVRALFHHDKNGFFYALDRTDGRFLYAEPIVEGINWTLGLDPQTGRPRPNPDMIAESGGPEVGPIIPSLEGAIDWQPLSYNPELRTLYFLSNHWAMGYKFWEEGTFEPPKNGEWYLGADYQQYLTTEMTGNFVAFDVVRRKIVWRKQSPVPFWAGSVATSGGLVFTGDMRGYFMALNARTGELLWQFQTGAGLIGSPITFELGGAQYLVVPSGGIGGDMEFYYKEPRAGNIWAFALEASDAERGDTRPNLTVLEGSLPTVGQPGHTLGGRVLPGYGFPPTEGGTASSRSEPSGSSPADSTESQGLAQAPHEDALARALGTYRAYCVGCHKAAGGVGPGLLRTTLSEEEFLETVLRGGDGMPSFRSVIDESTIRLLHRFLSTRDQL